METMNISLPPEMAAFVRQIVRREYGNTSEFLRELVRERMRREIQADLELLRATAKDAPAGPNEAEIAGIVKAQKQVRKDLRGERGS
jgi:Arc/MetJ-type ribon-helix-helix transcriptional regulator